MISWASTCCIDQLLFHYLDAWIKFVSWPILSDGEISSDQVELKSTQKQTISRGGKHKWSSTNWFWFGNVFWQGKKNFSSLFLVEKFTYTSDTYFFVFFVSPQGPHRGKRIDRIPYEDICKVDTWQQVPEPHLWSRKNGNVSAETWEKPHRIVNATLSDATNISKEKCFSNPRENVCYSILQRASTKPLSHEAILFFG